MQTCFLLSSQSPDTWSIFPGSDTSQPLAAGTEAGTECIYFTLTVATDLFHLLFLLPAFLPPLTSYYLPLKVLSFLSPYARCHEGKGCSVLELGICSSHTALQQGWTGQAHDGAALLFPQPQGWSRTAHIFSPKASATAENVFTGRKTTVVPMSAWARYARGESPCWPVRAMFWVCASVAFLLMPLWTKDKSSNLECRVRAAGWLWLPLPQLSTR